MLEMGLHIIRFWRKNIFRI